MGEQPISMDQVREKKAAMEEVIRQVIYVFEAQTGCVVKSVDIQRAFIIDRPATLLGVKTETSL